MNYKKIIFVYSKQLQKMAYLDYLDKNSLRSILKKYFMIST